MASKSTISTKGTKVLIFCLPAIGDALMATPLIRLLKKKGLVKNIDVACMFNATAYIFKNNPYVNNVFELPLYYSKNKFLGLKHLLKLRKKKYDISILAFPSYRWEYHLVQYIVGAKIRISHKFSKGYFSELNFLDTNLINFDETSHNVINNLNILETLGINYQDELKKGKLTYDFVLDRSDTKFAKQYISKLGFDNSIVAIHPGSTNSPAALLRRWPIERYAKLAKYLIRKKQKILLFIGPDEMSLGQKLYKLIDSPKNTQIVFNLEFNKAVAILNRVNLLICNDGGFAHVGVALNKKILTLWASTNDKWSVPYNPKLVTLIRPKEFKPWYSYDLKRKLPKNVKGGMEKITLKQAIEAVDRLI